MRLAHFVARWNDSDGVTVVLYGTKHESMHDLIAVVGVVLITLPELCPI